MDKPTSRTSWTAWVLALVVPLLLTLGCSRSASTSAGYALEAAPGYGYDIYGADGYYDEAADMVAESPPAPPDFQDSAKTFSRSSKREVSVDDEYESMAPDSATAPASAPAPKPAPKLEPEPVAEQPANKRQLIYTANMQVSVYDLAHAVSVAEALPTRLGGWLHQRVDNELILRIPAAKLEQAMELIAELGVVDYRLLEALDVTAQYTDLESRIRILVEMQAQLRALLDQAKDVEQALKIRAALDQITLELELARGQMRELAKSIAFSTLILRFVQRGPSVIVPTSNDPFPWVDQLGVELTEYR